MKNKKIVRNKRKLFTEGTLSKGFSDKSPICISLCLGELIDGLHLDLIVSKKGEKYGNFIAISMNGESIAHYDLKWADLAFFPMMGRLARNEKLLNNRASKK